MTNNNPDFKERFKQKYMFNRNVFGSKPILIIENAIKYVSSGRALDLGAGNGRNTLFLLSKSFEVTSVDSSKEGLQILEEKVDNKQKIKTILSDVRAFNTEEKYDLVVAIGLLHFLLKKEGNILIEKMQKWTNIGGINVIGAKMIQNFAGDLPHIFKKNELKKYYEKENWEIKEYSENKVAFLIAKK
jgi:tellurite methyltransferase